MDHVDGRISTRESSGSDSAPAIARSAASPGSNAWEQYYVQASRRRRSARQGRRSLREEKRRRRWRERMGLGLSALLVAAMTVAFYFVLTR
jgi:hypothetical protein